MPLGAVVISQAQNDLRERLVEEGRGAARHAAHLGAFDLLPATSPPPSLPPLLPRLTLSYSGCESATSHPYINHQHPLDDIQDSKNRHPPPPSSALSICPSTPSSSPRSSRHLHTCISEAERTLLLFPAAQLQSASGTNVTLN